MVAERMMGGWGVGVRGGQAKTGSKGGRQELPLPPERLPVSVRQDGELLGSLLSCLTLQVLLNTIPDLFCAT